MANFVNKEQDFVTVLHGRTLHQHTQFEQVALQKLAEHGLNGEYKEE